MKMGLQMISLKKEMDLYLYQRLQIG